MSKSAPNLEKCATMEQEKTTSTYLYQSFTNLFQPHATFPDCAKLIKRGVFDLKFEDSSFHETTYSSKGRWTNENEDTNNWCLSLDQVSMREPTSTHDVHSYRWGLNISGAAKSHGWNLCRNTTHFRQIRKIPYCPIKITVVFPLSHIKSSIT